MKSLRSQAEELAKRPYTIEIQPSETTEGEPSYIAYVLELEGCMGQGTTSEEAEADVRLAMVDFIEVMLEYRLPIPEPQSQRTSTTSTAGAKVNFFQMEQSKSEPEHLETRHVKQFLFNVVG